MSPLRWMQSTAPHWTVMVVDVLVALTEVGGSEGAAENKTQHMEDRLERSPHQLHLSLQHSTNLTSPASRVIAVTVLLTALLPAALLAVTVML